MGWVFTEYLLHTNTGIPSNKHWPLLRAIEPHFCTLSPSAGHLHTLAFTIAVCMHPGVDHYQYSIQFKRNYSLSGRRVPEITWPFATSGKAGGTMSEWGFCFCYTSKTGSGVRDWSKEYAFVVHPWKATVVDHAPAYPGFRRFSQRYWIKLYMLDFTFTSRPKFERIIYLIS